MAALILSTQRLVANAADGGGRTLTQQPEIAPSLVRGAALANSEPAASPRDLPKAGASPEWIWGADQNKRYFVKKSFVASAKINAARLRGSCDNEVTLYLNGAKVAQSDTWQAPFEADVRNHVRAGQNELLAEISNAGGPAGFVLLLSLSEPRRETTWVVSDATWQAAESRDAKEWAAVVTRGKLGSEPWGDVFAKPAESNSVPVETFVLLPGFQVERLFTVPKEELGSWVAIGFDNKGRLIASDQGDRGLCRITPPPIGGSEPTKVERLNVKITSAQGLLYAFDSLYVSVNGGPGSGLYRVRDTDGDDQFDEVTKLKDFRGGGEHGPHALRLSPDGKSIYVICGNHTDPPDDLTSSRIPTNWGEDLLLPRQWDANGHARGRLAPGGWIAKTDPDGKTWEIFSIGYRNAYDMAFNADGELFAYDADMEWDLGSPWYRPTRVTHATSGSEFGWRSGTGKWPPYYVDSLPPLVDIGPGSPVGVEFGYGAKFPAKYQKALYLLDWTFGTMYAIHMEPDGGTYRAVKEEFLSRTPLPLTDAAVGPDGALYFTVGGRGTQSELFRVTYVGKEPTDRVDAVNKQAADLRALRQKLEALHSKSLDAEEELRANSVSPNGEAKAAVYAVIYPHLGHADRFIRYAARVALERQPVSQWQDRVMAERDPQTLITGAVAFARQGDPAIQNKLVAALDRISWDGLDVTKQLELLRAYQLVFIRLGEPDDATRERVAAKLDALYPVAAENATENANWLNRELCTLLVYLRSPNVVSKTLALMEKESVRTTDAVDELLARNDRYGGAIAAMLRNRPDEQKIHYAFALRNMKAGWTLDQRKVYFQWFDQARKWSGGASYQGFLNNIDREAFENATEKERLAIEAFGARKPFVIPELPKPKGPGRDWTLEEVLALAENGLKGRDYKNGQKMYAATRCVICHRFAGEGGATGPDLTQLAGRFNVKDLSESILDPSKVMSDQYRASTVVMADGKVYTGRIVSETTATVTIVHDPEDPTKVAELRRDQIDEIQVARVSLMPKDLMKPLNENELLDLLAYLLSRGDPASPMFRK
jgi:putative heme-binding domain-containing protein